MAYDYTIAELEIQLTEAKARLASMNAALTNWSSSIVVKRDKLSDGFVTSETEYNSPLEIRQAILTEKQNINELLSQLNGSMTYVRQKN